MRTHYGHAVEDPTSLPLTKGFFTEPGMSTNQIMLLQKALVRHSLLLGCCIVSCMSFHIPTPTPLMFRWLIGVQGYTRHDKVVAAGKMATNPCRHQEDQSQYL